MNIYQKIAEVMKSVQYLSKDDNVSFGNTKYKAMSEEKVTAIMRAELLKNGLIVYPMSQICHRDGNITHVDVTYRMVNIDDPSEAIEIASAGDGADTQDKGSGKAMTYAFKYMFLRTFAIPTGEDPDKISSEQLDAEAKSRAEEQKKKKEGKDEAEKRMKVIKYANAHYTQEQIESIAKKYNKKSLNNLTSDDCDDFISALADKGKDINS